MRDLTKLTFHPTTEKIVNLLCEKTQNSNPQFFRIMVCYYICKMAASMRVSIKTKDRGVIPINFYGINLGISGSGKGFSTNILEDHIINRFHTNFFTGTLPTIAEENLAALAGKRAAVSIDMSHEEALANVKSEYASLGEMAFSFDSATTAAVKQMRHKLLMANVGAVNLEIDECYLPDIEILTEKGFQRFDQLDRSLDVAQFDPETKEISFVTPERYIENDYQGEVHNFMTPSGFDFSVTPNHEILVWNKGKQDFLKKRAEEVNTNDFIPLTGKIKPKYTIHQSITDELRLLIAIQADGTIRKGGNVELAFKRSRKITRLIEILNRLDIAFTKSSKKNGYTNFYLSKNSVKHLPLTKNLRDLLPNIKNVSREYCVQFIREVVRWDGSINPKLPNIWRYTNICKDSVNLVHCLAVLAGFNSKMYNNPKSGYGDCWYVSINVSGVEKASLAYLHKESGIQKPIHSISYYEGKVYCVTVPTGAIVLRRNGKSFIGGNCGSNILSNSEVLTTFLELYDVGKVKQKLTKNTKDNTRSKEIQGKTPTNLMMFGTPTKLFDGAKVESEFWSFVETGYGRRAFFGYTQESTRDRTLTAEQIYDRLTSPVSEQFMEDISKKFGDLAALTLHGVQIGVSRDVSLELIKYKMYCENLADKMNSMEEASKAEMAHRFFKALKLAGAYAFIDGHSVITEDNLYHAICMAEESGKAFEKMRNQDEPYVKLAKYIASIKREVTHVDLAENMPFYRGSATQKQELLKMAIIWGYQNSIIIKQKIDNNIEFISGEALEKVDLDDMYLSHSSDLAEGYKNKRVPFDKIIDLVKLDFKHWCNHHTEKGHRLEDEMVPGFNLVVIDVDGGTTIKEVIYLLQDYKYLIHTTKRHTPADNRFRIIFPLNYNLKLSEDDFKEFMANVYEWLPFNCDISTGQRSRKWLTYKNGMAEYSKGEKLLDALLFIPRTTKNTLRKLNASEMKDLSSVERWFLASIEKGNRNNQLIRYALMLVDSGYNYGEIEQKVGALNTRIDPTLSDVEIRNTIMKSVEKALTKKGVY